MKQRPTRSALCAALIGSTCMAVSPNSLACSPEPYLSAVCILAIPWTNLQGYAPANGATLNVNTNQALYALIGNIYGGTPGTNFMLPDLQGRVVVGAGTGAGLPAYIPGNKGGTNTVMLTSANVPLVAHTHALGQGPVVTVALGSLAATTTLAGLAATTSLSNVTATASASGLSLKGYSGSGVNPTASGGALATPASPTNKIYASSTPDVTMMAGSISGTAPVSFAGNPTTTITGNPSTTLTGLPTVTLGGNTAPASQPASAPVSILQPYLALNYFIAVEGIFPTRN